MPNNGFSVLNVSQSIPSVFTGRRRLIGWLIAVCFLFYGNTLSNDYVLDDVAFVSQHSQVQKGFAGIPAIWSSPSLRGFALRPVYDTAASNDIYRPISLTTFAVEVQMFGSKPAISHFINVALFALCVVLLFRFVDGLTSHRFTGAAFVTALLFACHPIHTEVVANVKSRDELLCFAFCFAALLQVLGYARSGGLARLLAAAGLYLLSLLSKESSIAMVLLAPAAMLVAQGPVRARTLAVLAAFAGVAAAYWALRWGVLNAYNAYHPGMIEFMENPLVGAGSRAMQVGTALSVMWRYLLLLFLPYPLSSDYTFSSIPFVGPGSVQAILAICAYAALAAGTAWLWQRGQRLYAFAISFFLGTLAVTTNLFFLTGSIMAERFLFFPSVGFCMALGFLLHKLLAGRANVLRLGIPAAICLAYAPIVIARNADWRTNYSLALADVVTYPQNARLHHSVAYVLATERLTMAVSGTEQASIAQEAAAHYRQSLAIYPRQSKVHTDYANLLFQLRQPDSAEAHIRQALLIRPGEPVILSMLGGVYFGRGEYHKTLALCRQALLRAPADNAILFNMSMCHLMLHQFDSVVAISELLLQKDPANAAARANLTVARDSLAARNAR